MGSIEWTLVLALVLAAVAIYLLTTVLLTNNSDKEILSWASGNEPTKSRFPLVNWSRPLVHNFTLQHALRFKDPAYRKRVTHLILTSGLSKELNVDEFIGLQILWSVLTPAIMSFLNLILELDLPWYFLLATAPLGLLGPQIYANQQKKFREISVRIDLPFFTDLLALSTEAGLDFISAIQRIVEKAEESVLAEELSIVLKDIKLGSSRADALRGLAHRLDMSEITSFVAVLIDADATGASIAQVLKDQSVQIRLDRFVRAEKAGARASQMMLVPMIFFILPAVFLVVFGPVVVQFMSGGMK